MPPVCARPLTAGKAHKGYPARKRGNGPKLRVQHADFACEALKQFLFAARHILLAPQLRRAWRRSILRAASSAKFLFMRVMRSRK